MKFDCGPTAEEKRDIKRRKLEARCNAMMDWNKWFAWYPIKIGHRDCRWLEYIERKAQKRYSWIGRDLYFSAYKTVHSPKWEYRKIND
jgi:hypothetical protein